MNQYIKSFNQIDKKSVKEAGGKGASLGEMTKAGIQVPPGFVILIDAFDRFLEETDLGVEIASQIKKINYKDINSVDRASNVIRDLIHDAAMPKDLISIFLKEFKKLRTKYVAVRSSATAEDSAVASFAGELETYLNTTQYNLIENIKECWSSLFTPRALFYAFEREIMTVDHQKKVRARTCKKLDDCYPVGVAVVVQKMVESEVSGISFSVHPVTEDRNQLIIEASFGLGEAIVQGQITPDSYVVEKKPFRIIDKNVVVQDKGFYRSEKGGNEWRKIPESVGKKQVLSDKEILQLAELILKIEKHYGFPVDVEWAREKKKFYIVQSRPITTL